MSMTEMDEFGPVDYVVVEFPAGQSNFDGGMAKELAALVDDAELVDRPVLLDVHRADLDAVGAVAGRGLEIDRVRRGLRFLDPPIDRALARPLQGVLEDRVRFRRMHGTLPCAA